jgi:hypothetical protein
MRSLTALATAAVTLLPTLALAQPDITPNFGAVVTGAQAPGVWYTDRYAPAAFETVAGPVAGRSNVLHIGISSADELSSRPAAYQSMFYNTQGRKYDLNHPGAFTLSADLYVDESWGNADAPYERSDMWGTMKDNGGNVTGYPIIGFTNQGQLGARFRGWDSVNPGAWLDFSAPVLYDAWNTLAFTYDGLSTITYSVNGAAQGTVSVSGSTQIGDVIMQAYNFDNTNFGPGANQSYDVYWSNTQMAAVPEPGSIALVATGLAGVGAVIRRRRRTA